MTNEMSLKNVARGWGDLLRRASRNVLPLFVIFAGIEVAALCAVTIAVPKDARFGDLVHLFDGRYPVWMPVAVILLVVMSVMQSTLPAAIRPVVIDEVPVSLKSAFGACMLKLPSMIFLFFVTTFIISATLAVLFAAGAQVMVIALMLIQFALKPAEWLVAGRDRPVLNAVGQSWRWSRRHGIWILGVQSAIALVTAGVTAKLELDPMVPLTIVAFATGHMAVRFIQWSGVSGLFIALDRAEYGR